MPLINGGQPGQRSEHPAATAKTLADWWRRYILPRDGVLRDPFCGSGQILASGLDCGAVEVEREAKYLDRRVKAI